MSVNQMTEYRRNLILALADEYPIAFRYIHTLERTYRREEIYRWFIANKITGKKLEEFFIERKYSFLKVVKDVLHKIDGVRKDEIRAGIDL
jgi:hypothetical protein